MKIVLVKLLIPCQTLFIVVDAVAKRKRNGLERSGFETSPGHYAFFLGGIFLLAVPFSNSITGYEELTNVEV